MILVVTDLDRSLIIDGSSMTQIGYFLVCLFLRGWWRLGGMRLIYQRTCMSVLRDVLGPMVESRISSSCVAMRATL